MRLKQSIHQICRTFGALGRPHLGRDAAIKSSRSRARNSQLVIGPADRLQTANGCKSTRRRRIDQCRQALRKHNDEGGNDRNFSATRARILQMTSTLEATPGIEPNAFRAGLASRNPVAIFLDVDGTLLDLAERPNAVVAPPRLIPTLADAPGRPVGRRRADQRARRRRTRSTVRAAPLARQRRAWRADALRSGIGRGFGAAARRTADGALEAAAAFAGGLSGNFCRKQTFQLRRSFPAGAASSRRPCARR